MTSVAGPICFLISSLLPIAEIRPPLTANASARGCFASSVRMFALTTTRSAALLCTTFAFGGHAKRAAADAAPKMMQAASTLLFLVNHTSVNYRVKHLRVPDLHGVDGKDVVREYYDIADLADLDSSFDAVLILSVR